MEEEVVLTGRVKKGKGGEWEVRLEQRFVFALCASLRFEAVWKSLSFGFIEVLSWQY